VTANYLALGGEMMLWLESRKVFFQGDPIQHNEKFDQISEWPFWYFFHGRPMP
jgi:hypothetical protein